MTTRHLLVVVGSFAVLLYLSCASPAGAAIYTHFEDFGTVDAPFPGTDYTNWIVDNLHGDPATWEVSSFRLQVSGGTNYSTNIACLATPTLSSGRVSAVITPVQSQLMWTSPGLWIGNIGFRFTTGYSSLLVSPGGNPTAMGFAPVNGTPYTMQIDFTQRSTDTDFTVTVSGGGNTSNIMDFTYSNEIVKTIDKVGFVRVNSGTVTFDDFSIQGNTVPEPATIGMFSALCLFGFGLARRRRVER